MSLSGPSVARRLFGQLGPSYERWASILSLGQDRRWRRSLVDHLNPRRRSLVLDLAAGTGSITRRLSGRGAEVISVDQSQPMLAVAVSRGATAVIATAEALPFKSDCFDAVSFGYLLRYVESVEGCLREVARVTCRGGRVGMLEFGRPRGLGRVAWWFYTRVVFRIVGGLLRGGWREVGRFLGPSIDRFVDTYPPMRLAVVWEDAGLRGVGFERMSFGGGLVMWGTAA